MFATVGWLNAVLLLGQLADIVPQVVAYEYRQSVHDSIVVNTTSGPVRGTYINRHIRAFRGIPYAQSPTGKLRFEAPKPIEAPSSKILDATDYGYACIQNAVNFAIPTPGSKKGENEDCLTVNVFTSQKRGKNETGSGLRPVMIWIHGGGFTEGFSASYEPTNILEEHPDVVVVTFNYRLNIFGFPITPALGSNSSNPGFRDQRLAISWVRDNIHFFGGDPSRIVAAGQSAGSASIASYIYAYPEDPILKGAIMMSGQATLIGPPNNVEFDRVAGVLGCQNQVDRQKELECMKAVDAPRLRRAVNNATRSELAGGFSGGLPGHDNVTSFSPEILRERAQEGRFAKIPVLIGDVENEGDLLIPWTPRGINYTFSDILTLALFQCPTAAEANIKSTNGIQSWRYRYRGSFPGLKTSPWLRSYHGEDLLILFWPTTNFRSTNSSFELSPVEEAAGAYLRSAWMAFVRKPETGLLDLDWPVYNPNSTSLVELFKDNKPRVTYANPREYDRACDNPPSVPYEGFTKRPPPCDPCFD